MIIVVPQIIQMSRNMASTLLGFFSVLLTLGLVYHSLAQRPELWLTGFSIEPCSDGQLVCKDTYTKQTRNTQGLFVPSPKSKPYNRKVKMLECKDAVTELRISNDIANLGYRATLIHDYEVEQIEPTEGATFTYPIRKRLSYQQARTTVFNYPDDKSIVKLQPAIYGWKWRVRSATDCIEKEIWIKIADDNAVYWSEKRKPISKVKHPISVAS